MDYRPAARKVERESGAAGAPGWRGAGQVDVRYLDRSEERIHFFASRLKYSRWIDVRLVENERVEALVSSLLAGFASFGGIPLVAAAPARVKNAGPLVAAAELAAAAPGRAVRCSRREPQDFDMRGSCRGGKRSSPGHLRYRSPAPTAATIRDPPEPRAPRGTGAAPWPPSPTGHPAPPSRGRRARPLHVSGGSDIPRVAEP